MTQVIIDHLTKRVTIRPPADCDMAFIATNVSQHQPRFIVGLDFPLKKLVDAFSVKKDHSPCLRKGDHARDVSILPFNSQRNCGFNIYAFEPEECHQRVRKKLTERQDIVVVGANMLTYQKPLHVRLPHQIYPDLIQEIESWHPDAVGIFVAPARSQDKVTITRDELEAPRARNA